MSLNKYVTAGTTASEPRLPGEFPVLPDAVQKRFPQLEEYTRESERFWRKVRGALLDSQEDISRDIDSAVKTAANGLLNLSTRVAGNESSISTILTTYATQSYADTKKTEAIAASATYTDTQITAAVTTEASARATADGFLSGKYTIKVTAGNVVTGMNITSSTGAGTDVSDVTFQATSFKIYNGTSGVAPFQVTGGQVKVQSLVIVASDVGGLAATATSSDFASVTGATKPANNADVTLTAINGGLSITGGGLILSSSAMIRAGQTAYDTGTGFFLGMSGAVPKFSIGVAGGQGLRWDGTSLTINGSITLQNTIAAGSVTGLASTATSSDFASITGATKPANNADVTLSAINGGLSVTGGGLTLSSGGAIKGGSTAYNTGTGFFLGYEAGQYKFSIGNPAGNRVTWDGSTLTVRGTLDASDLAAGTVPTARLPTSVTNALIATVTVTGSVWSTSGYNDISGASITATTDASTRLVVATGTMYNPTPTSLNYTIRVLRDGTSIGEFLMQSAVSGVRIPVYLSISDTPGAGSHTYKLQSYASVGGTAIVGDPLTLTLY